ncbi:MAG: hypothetical protein PWP19_1729 [Thermococcaceae archaeon]|jgi:hypothetical protein|uniref:DUF4932 domain-containing protein n=1 Tax=Thermococcus bergensis TaxID=2689387 RepID=UPI001CEC3F24|nr:DUF4932 domain-containing protein [Thermococcus bergensis]MCA6213916.1 DUF4932 domain-containing protein [Thermococcus bergensis]MDK2854136.1 hypothetical protein [Thermococcaceae archaeon]MDK2984251.1 hypothetical protein [Thermococcaceae archaeon]
MRRLAAILMGILLVTSISPGFHIVQAQEPKMVVEVNPNLELLAVLYILAFNGSDLFIIGPQDYVQDVLTYFAPYKDHEAVHYIRKIMDNSYSYYSRDNTIMALSDRLVLLDYLPNETNLGDLKPLAEFANESNFMEFYRAHEKEYAEYISSIEPYLKSLPELHREFFGYAAKEYRVEYSYSLRIHGHTFETLKDGVAYCINYIYIDRYDEVQKIHDVIGIFHEFTHPFVEDFLVETDELFEDKSYYLYGVKNQLPITATYDYNHFWSFEIYLNEALTESLAAYFALKSGIPRDSVKFRILMESLLFPMIQDFLEEYEHFEKIRGENETLFDYAPIMAEHMGRWATPENVSEYFKMNAPVTEGLAMDRIGHLKKVIIVYGTQNPDKSGVEYDRETAEECRRFIEEGFSISFGYTPKVVIKADVNLTDEDLRENLILIGGPVANKVTRELNDRLPITFVHSGNGWSLKRNPGVVKDFNAFLFADEGIIELSLNSTIPYDGSMGVLQTIRNPWNEKNFVIVLAGLTRYGTRNISKNQSSIASYKILGENYKELGFYKQYKG